uniref:Uncharacterized protein n=1 Tax=Gasterosteus aculeatus TaxID=69293 RepID=G3QA54_GASAC
MEGGLLLDVVVGEGAAIFQLLAGKDQPLLIWGDAFLILDLGLHVLDGVAGLDLQRDGLASEGLHKDLHASPQTQHKMEGGFLLDVVVGEGAAIFQLLAGKDQPLLIWGDAFLILDLGLHVLDGVAGLDLQRDGLASEGLHEDLHASPQTQHKMEGGFLLDVVVGEGAAIFQLLAGKDQPLLIWGDAFLILDLGLHVLDGVAGLDLQRDGLASEGLHKDLHASPQTQHKMEGGFLLDVVVGEGAAIFQLLAGKDQPLLIWGDAFLILDLGLHVLDGVAGL